MTEPMTGPFQFQTLQFAEVLNSDRTSCSHTALFRFLTFMPIIYIVWDFIQVFFHWASPKKLKYGKPRLDESTLT